MLSKHQPTKQPDSTVRALIEKAEQASALYLNMNQQQIDDCVQNMALAGIKRHMELAKLELKETGRGIFEDKMIKNMFATETVFHQLKYMRTVGELENNEYEQYKVIAEPIGIIVSYIPNSTNVATLLMQSIIAVKTRNPIIFILEPSIQKSSVHAIETMLDELILTGAPASAIQWMVNEQQLLALDLVSSSKVKLLILSENDAFLKAAQGLGKQLLYADFANVPCYIHKSADLKQAITDIILSKSFDHSMMYTAEQAILVDQEVYNTTLRMLNVLGCYILSEEETQQLSAVLFDDQKVFKREYIGKSAHDIARLAQIDVPEDTKLLISIQYQHGSISPLSTIKPAPILALFIVKDVEDAVKLSKELVQHSSAAHLAVIHAQNDDVINYFGTELQTTRVIINSPSSQSSVSYKERKQFPFYDLGYSSLGASNDRNYNLIQHKYVSNRNINMQWFKIPPKMYFSAGATQYLTKMPNINRIFIVTDPTVEALGYLDKVKYFLSKRTEPYTIDVFSGVAQEPDIDIVKQGTKRMNEFKPDCIIALGGGSTLDAAKAMWLFYESPDTNFDTIKMKFMDIRSRVYKYPHLGKRAKLVAIPTTSGTGSEVTSFATITDSKNGQLKYPLADYELTPDVAIIDSEFTKTLPKEIIADSGMDVLCHAIESYVSVMANDFSDGLAIKAIQLVLEHLEKSYGVGDSVSREKMHHASTIAGMAFSNAFLGICHSLSHKLSAEFLLPHGRVNAILLPHVIKYNASRPTKFQSFANYKHFQADVRYAEISRLAGLPATSTTEGVNSLISAIRKLNRSLGIPESFSEIGLSATIFESKVDYLAERAFEDQYTNYNPRMPLVSELTQLYRQAFYGQFE